VISDFDGNSATDCGTPVYDLLAEASRGKSNEILLSEIRLGVAADFSLHEK
jgi:hypothetical protein